jgi:hypothetical protein
MQVGQDGRQYRNRVLPHAEMFMFRVLLRAAAQAYLALASNAEAHCFVGQRFLPATLATDDPCVADEMSIPTVSWPPFGG